MPDPAPRRLAWARAAPLRLALLLGTVLLLVVLLEMHRCLPGGWPGGGGPGGFRRLDVGEGSDPAQLARAEGWKPDWKPRDGVTMRVRLPGGTDAPGWRATAGDGGQAEGPERGGDRVLLRDASYQSQGFSVRWGADSVLTHAAPPASEATPTWRVALPAAALPARLGPRSVTLSVVRAGSGAPLAGAKVRVGDELAPRSTDERGHLAVPTLRALTRVTVEAEGHAPAEAWVHPQAAADARIELSPLLTLWTPFLDAGSRAETPILAGRLVARDGRVLWEAVRTPSARPARIEAQVPAASLRGARLSVQSEGRPLTEVAFEPGTREVLLADRGRALTLTARGSDGQPVALRTAQASYAAGGRGAPSEGRGVLERLEPGRDGSMRLVVPADAPATVVVESGQHAPAVVRIDGQEPGGAREVRLEAGVRVPVLVLDRRGRPVRDAQVLARVVLDGVRVEVEARTDPEGRARVGPLPAGPCEVLAHAPGKAWAARAAEARNPMQDIELRLLPGAPLRLQVASPFGVPLAGVRVTAVPTDEGPAPVEPPGAPEWVTDAAGRLLMPDLPLRAWRLRLELPGWQAETLDAITPGPIWYFATLVEERGG
ncbi:MAG: hypothetical protein ACKOSS_10595 [Planctomycetia bacterium]